MMLMVASFKDPDTTNRLATLLRNAYGIQVDVRRVITRSDNPWHVYADGNHADYLRASGMAHGFVCALDPEA